MTMHDSSPDKPAPRWVIEEVDISVLAHRVVDEQRSVPLVCVTTQPYLQRPMLDPNKLNDALGGQADVWVVTRAQHAWALTTALPPGLDVYGGATRVWWPIKDITDINPRDHPLFTIFNPDDAPRVVGQIASHVRQRLAPAPVVGSATTGVVTATFEHGAEIMLASGHAAFAANAHLARGPIYRSWEAVRIGQQVRVRVSGAAPAGRSTLPVSLLPFAPEPWERLGEVYEAGMVVEGIVHELRNIGAFVELIPGATGLLPKNRISQDHVSHPEDYLAVDDRVVVRLRSLEPDERKAELSLIEVPEDAHVEPPISLYPDGPPWLLPVPRKSSDVSIDVPADKTEAIAVSPEISPSDPNQSTEPVDALPPSPCDADVVAPAADEEPLAEAATSAERGTERSSDNDIEGEITSPDVDLFQEDLGAATRRVLDDLLTAINDAQSIHGGLIAAEQTAESELRRLGVQARQLVRELREDIADAELRVLRLGTESPGEIVRETQHEVEGLKQEIAELRERLLSAERDREALIRQNRTQTAKTASLTKRRDEAVEQASGLRRELDHVDGGDPGLRFMRELHFTWSQIYKSEHDKSRFAFKEPIIGPAFLGSLEKTEGISRERVLEVCAHVVAGRASAVNSLKLHQLRTSAAGDAPFRVRHDGATAWRVSLQDKTPSARRLHYWLLRDGRVELSKIGVHDDLDIV